MIASTQTIRSVDDDPQHDREEGIDYTVHEYSGRSWNFKFHCRVHSHFYIPTLMR